MSALTGSAGLGRVAGWGDEEVVDESFELAQVVAATGAHDVAAPAELRLDLVADHIDGMVHLRSDEDRLAAVHVVEDDGGNGVRLPGAGWSDDDAEWLAARRVEDLALGGAEDGGDS